MNMNPRPPLPPFTEETALQKVQAAEGCLQFTATRERVNLACTENIEWRFRTEFINGRAQVVNFSGANGTMNWITASRKELWGFRLATAWPCRFEYEWHDDSSQWFPFLQWRLERALGIR